MKNAKALKSWSKRNIPEDLWPEILSTLPVKSLLRFRCVFSSWRALIDDPEFGRIHLTCFSNNRFQSHLFVIEGARKKECLVKCSKGLRTTARLGCLRTDFGADCVVGSIDGLFMLRKSPSFAPLDLVLWNPSIRLTKTISPSPRFPGDVKINLKFGLGFDPLVNDYKYVRFVKKAYSGVWFVAIYTVGTDSWKTIEFQGEGYSSWCEDFSFAHPHRTFCLKGVLYALASSKHIARYKLVSFDLNNEVFASIGVPEAEGDAQQQQWHSLALTVADGGSSLAVVMFSRSKASIWVSESVGGDTNSLTWTQRFTFPAECTSFAHTFQFLYLGRNDNEEVLLKSHTNEVISYNLETHEEKTAYKKTLVEAAI